MKAEQASSILLVLDVDEANEVLNCIARRRLLELADDSQAARVLAPIASELQAFLEPLGALRRPSSDPVPELVDLADVVKVRQLVVGLVDAAMLRHFAEIRRAIVRRVLVAVAVVVLVVLVGAAVVGAVALLGVVLAQGTENADFAGDHARLKNPLKPARFRRTPERGPDNCGSVPS